MHSSQRAQSLLAALALCLVVACSGTPSSSVAPELAREAAHTPESPSAVIAESTTELAEASGGIPDIDQAALMRDALRGVVTDSGAAMGSRQQLRQLRIPSPPRGAASKFNWGQGKRGFITALPRETLLTTPAYHNGKLYLGGGFSSHLFFAIDAFEGEMRWAIAAPDGGPTAAVVADDKVCFNTESCTIFCADAETGELRWKRWLGDPLMSQPAVYNDLVLSAYPVSGGHKFGAYRLDDGEPVWDVEIANDVIQAPHVRGEHVYFATMDGTAYKLRARDGHEVWARQVKASSAVWVEGDHVLLSRRVDEGEATKEQAIVLSARTGRITSRGQQYNAPYFGGESRDRRMFASINGAWGNVRDREHLGFRNVASGWAFQGSSPTVSEGRAYYAVAGALRARDVATGEDVWTREYAEAEGAQAISPPAVVGSQLVFGTVDGHLYFADIDTGMIIRAFDVGQPVVFQPVVAQGWVYVATGNGNLIGLELGDAALDGWHMWGGNAQHNGLVPSAGQVDPQLLASLERPSQGAMQIVPGVDEEEEEQSEATGPTVQTPADIDVPLPLLDTNVRAEVSGPVATVHVTQRFENPSDDTIEAVYLFPLPENAAVDDMVMRFGDVVVRGQIKRRRQARQVYEQARSEGRRAALLEQQRPNLFAQRVANIPPGGSIEVTLRYVQTVPFEDGRYEFSYPMIAPPRFDPDDPSAVLRPPAELRAGRSVQLSVSLDGGLPIQDVRSATHPVSVERDGTSRANVTLEREGQIPNRDFVLRYDLAGQAPDAAVFAHRPAEGDGALTLVVQPPTSPDASFIAARDIRFVVDTSSSMRGAPMTQAKAVMRTVLASLREDDVLNVYAFGDSVTKASPTALDATEASVDTASAFVDGLQAQGTTRMVPAIEAALSDQVRTGSVPMVVLLTDGFIANEAEVLRAIAGGLGQSRLFTLGVGSATNDFLLQRASEVGRGRMVKAALSDDPADVGARFASYIDRPVLTDVTVDWDGLDVRDVYPARIPDLFAGKPLVLHGRFGQGGHATVKLRGTLGGRRVERRIQVALPSAGGDSSAGDSAPGSAAFGNSALGNPAHTTLWARAAIKERMTAIALRDDEQLIEEVTQLGLEHRIVTQWTSFVAVEERAPEEEPEEEGEAQAASRATVSPARSLPGDPEIRIPAPADAQAVTVVLPFGETLSANFEADLGVWSTRFLVPADAEEGTYPIEIFVTLSSGEQQHLRVWYTVDATAPEVDFEVEGEARPGSTITLRARQRITEADLRQVGRSPGQLSAERVVLLSDVRRVELRTPSGEVIDLHVAGPLVYEAEFTIPEDARDSIEATLVTIDLAANVVEQTVRIEVTP